MKITGVTTHVLVANDVNVGATSSAQDAFVVELQTDAGITGIGESDVNPWIARACIEARGTHTMGQSLADMLIDANPLDPTALWQRLYDGSAMNGRRGALIHALGAIDIALWDIAGKAAGRPITDMLGGRRIADVPVYASEVMPETVDDVRRIAERAASDGYPALKLGWGPLGRDPDHDVALVRAARETLGPARTLMLDGGRAYSVKSALQLLQRIEEHDLYWFEEALAPDDLGGYRRLSDATTVRIAAGEADATLPPFRALVEQGHVDVLQPDLARCGGFTVARQIALLERSSAVQIVPHCFSTAVLVAASLHFVATLDRPTWSEFSVADSTLVNGILREPFRLQNGRLSVPTGPGLGIELDDELIDRLRVS